MQTGYQCCATHTKRPFGLVWNAGTGTGVQSFDKFNCALMSANLRQPDAIWEPDCPVRRAEEKRQRPPKKRNKHTASLRSSAERQTAWLTAETFQSAGNTVDYRGVKGAAQKGFERPTVWRRPTWKATREALVRRLKAGDADSKPLSHTGFEFLSGRRRKKTPFPMSAAGARNTFRVRSAVGQQILIRFLSPCLFFPPWAPRAEEQVPLSVCLYLCVCLCVCVCVWWHNLQTLAVVYKLQRFQ